MSPPPIDPAEVLAFIQASGEADEPASAPPENVPVSAELEGLDAADLEQAAQTTSSDLEQENAPDPDVPQTVGEMLNQMGPAATGFENLESFLQRRLDLQPGEGDVTEADKNAFTDAICHAAPMELRLALPRFAERDLFAQFRCITARERRLANRAADRFMQQLAKELAPAMPPPEEYHEALIRYHVSYQLSFWPGLKEFVPLSALPQQSDADALEALQAHAKLHFEDLPDPTWRVMMRTQRLFEVKMLTLQSHANDPNFWLPATDDSV